MEKKYPIDPDFIDYIKAERNAISKEMLNDEWWLCMPSAKRVAVENILIAYDQMVVAIANAQAPTGAVWVKASERLPEKDGLYCFRVSGGYMGAYVTTGPKGNRWVRDASWFTIANWKDCEWLDESGTAKVNPDELWDEFSEYIDTDIDSCQAFAGSTVMTKEGWRKVVERLKM